MTSFIDRNSPNGKWWVNLLREVIIFNSDTFTVIFIVLIFGKYWMFSPDLVFVPGAGESGKSTIVKQMK